MLVVQGKLAEALDAYQQGLAIAKRLAEQDKSNFDWQRGLIVSIYNVGTAMGKIAGNNNLRSAQGLLHTALDLVKNILDRISSK